MLPFSELGSQETPRDIWLAAGRFSHPGDSEALTGWGGSFHRLMLFIYLLDHTSIPRTRRIPGFAVCLFFILVTDT